MSEDKELFAVLDERLETAENLLKRCENIEPHVEGKQKLCKKVRAELAFLTSVSNVGLVKFVRFFL